jgi:two-component sensor histidine kinase
VFFREEVARYVSWAGDPNKSATVGPLGDRLTPRKSFQLWKEAVQGQSLPWKPVECRIAESLRVSLLEVILRLTSATAEERRRGQERQELLIAELNHRVRNILGLIRGVLSQSRDTNTSVESFMSVVGGRIQALARAHDLVTTDQWGPASFKGLVEAEAAAYLGRKAERVLVTGPDALLEPQAFTTVALVLHEMVTNSAKYGALSDSRGRVEISTKFDQLGRYAIGWLERGGPPVKTPTRRGFGSVIIERSIQYDLKGESQVVFEVAGVRADFVIPSGHVVVHKQMDRQLASSSTMPSEFDPPDDVLIVEDNMIIALDCEDLIEGLGVKSVRIASNANAAFQMIGEQEPDFALLDINLGEETSFDIAKNLLDRRIPFAFASGYGEQVAFPPEFGDVERVRKPYDANALREALGKRKGRA